MYEELNSYIQNGAPGLLEPDRVKYHKTNIKIDSNTIPITLVAVESSTA